MVVWTIFQEAENVHLKASDHRSKRRWGMKKCNDNLMLRVLLWEQSPYVLVVRQQSLSWDQTLFSFLGVLVAGVDNISTFHSCQNCSLFLMGPLFWAYPWQSRLQTVCSGFVFFAYNTPSPSVTSVKLPCQDPVLVPGFCLAGFVWFFFICQHVKAALPLFKKAKTVRSATIQLEVVEYLWWSLKPKWVFNLASARNCSWLRRK